MQITLINVCGRLSGEGSRLISALLKRAGHRVQRVFLTRLHQHSYTERELTGLDGLLRDADLALVAVNSIHARRAVDLTRYLRKRFPGLRVIWGGPHCVAAPQQALRYADGVCYAEGDVAVAEFVDHLQAGDERWRRTPNV